MKRTREEMEAREKEFAGIIANLIASRKKSPSPEAAPAAPPSPLPAAADDGLPDIAMEDVVAIRSSSRTSSDVIPADRKPEEAIEHYNKQIADFLAATPLHTIDDTKRERLYTMLYDRATAKGKVNDLAGAKEDLMEAYELHPESPRYHTELAYLQLNHYEDGAAERSLEIATHINKDYLPAQLVWAELALIRSEHDKAKEHLNVVIAKTNADIKLKCQAYSMRGYIETIQTGRYAESDHQAALEKQDKTYKGAVDDVVQYYTAMSLYHCGRHFEARSHASSAIQLNPYNDKAQVIGGKACAALKDTALAMGKYNEAIRLNPRNAEAYQQRALMYEKNGDSTKAVADKAMYASIVSSLTTFGDFHAEFEKDTEALYQAAITGHTNEVVSCLQEYKQYPELGPKTKHKHRIEKDNGSIATTVLLRLVREEHEQGIRLLLSSGVHPLLYDSYSPTAMNAKEAAALASKDTVWALFSEATKDHNTDRFIRRVLALALKTSVHMLHGRQIGVTYMEPPLETIKTRLLQYYHDAPKATIDQVKRAVLKYGIYLRTLDRKSNIYPPFGHLINAVDEQGNTLLHELANPFIPIKNNIPGDQTSIALRYRRIEMIKDAVKLGANMTMQNSVNNTPIGMARGVKFRGYQTLANDILACLTELEKQAQKHLTAVQASRSDSNRNIER